MNDIRDTLSMVQRVERLETRIEEVEKMISRMLITDEHLAIGGKHLADWLNALDRQVRTGICEERER